MRQEGKYFCNPETASCKIADFPVRMTQNSYGGGGRGRAVSLSSYRSVELSIWEPKMGPAPRKTWLTTSEEESTAIDEPSKEWKKLPRNTWARGVAPLHHFNLLFPQNWHVESLNVFMHPMSVWEMGSWQKCVMSIDAELVFPYLIKRLKQSSTKCIARRHLLSKIKKRKYVKQFCESH